MANAYTLARNRFKKMELNELEYRILKVAEDHRDGRDIGAEYYGTHTRDESLLALDGYDGTDVLENLDAHGIVEPYGHPFRFIVSEKGRLLMRLYECQQPPANVDEGTVTT